MLFGYDKDGMQVRVGDRVRCVDTQGMRPENTKYFQYPSDTYIVMHLYPTPPGRTAALYCNVCRCRDGKLATGWFVERFKLVSTQDDKTHITRRLTVKRATQGTTQGAHDDYAV